MSNVSTEMHARQLLYRYHCHTANSGRLVKQEQWERWRAKRKLVSRYKASGTLLRGGITPGKISEIVY